MFNYFYNDNMAFAVPILQIDFLKILTVCLEYVEYKLSNIELTAKDGGQVRFVIVDFRATAIMSDY